MYTQNSFKSDLEMIERATQSENFVALSAAIARGKALLTAGGEVGSVVSGANKLNLERLVSRCESLMSSAMTQGPAPKKPSDDGNDGKVDA